MEVMEVSMCFYVAFEVYSENRVVGYRFKPSFLNKKKNYIFLGFFKVIKAWLIPLTKAIESVV